MRQTLPSVALQLSKASSRVSVEDADEAVDDAILDAQRTDVGPVCFAQPRTVVRWQGQAEFILERQHFAFADSSPRLVLDHLPALLARATLSMAQPPVCCAAKCRSFGTDCMTGTFSVWCHVMSSGVPFRTRAGVSTLIRRSAADRPAALRHPARTSTVHPGCRSIGQSECSVVPGEDSIQDGLRFGRKRWRLVMSQERGPRISYSTHDLRDRFVSTFVIGGQFITQVVVRPPH